MSKKQKTPQEDNFSTKDEDDLAMLQWQINDGEKKAEFIVMGGIIPHVLERILSFLPMSSLKECRLVNTDWNRAAILNMRKDHFYHSFPPQTVKFNSLRDIMLHNKISPFAKFLIYPDKILSQDMERILNTIAPSATHLDISREGYQETRFDPLDRIPQFPMLTNLRQSVRLNAVPTPRFNLDQFVSENGENGLIQRSTVFGILEKSPKLQRLEVEFWGRRPSYLKDLLLKSLKEKNNANLNHLRFYGNFDSDFSQLIPLGLRLRSLCLNFFYVRDVIALSNDCSFIDFLSCQSETLLHLEIEDLTGIFDRFQFPLLKKLKTLTITSWKPLSVFFTSSPSINYNEKLPSLKKLQFTNSPNYWMLFLPNDSYTPVQEAMEVLKLDLPNRIREDVEIYVLHIEKCFPNLKVLGEIPVNLRIANSIYKWLPKLEELTFIVGFTQSIDNIITGLSLKKCAAIRLLSISEIRKLSVDNNQQNLDEDSPRPLSSLKNLKILRLKVKEPNYQPVEFSRVPTLLVLTKMPSLETIDFGWRSMAYIEKIEDDIRDLEDSGKSVLYSV